MVLSDLSVSALPVAATCPIYMCVSLFYVLLGLFYVLVALPVAATCPFYVLVGLFCVLVGLIYVLVAATCQRLTQVTALGRARGRKCA